MGPEGERDQKAMKLIFDGCDRFRLSFAPARTTTLRGAS